MNNDWNKKTIKKPLVIAGPCSAESRSQILTIAKQLKEVGVDYYRAGIWKPRTRPGSFEGVGAAGLEWLQEAKKEFGLPICTEVANIKHVYDALRARVDMLWIGARTTTNPFAVQEIADALKGVDIPIMIKNPINPDLQLWIGAIERFQKNGISKVAAIHRGFSSYGKSKYRNQPKWQIAIDLQRTFPDMPIISDPSHIGGSRDLVEPITQKAMDLNFDGMMIETHNTPDKAWSDAQQQITPKELNKLLNNLVIREAQPPTTDGNTLAQLRNEISDIDLALLDLLQKRMNTSSKIGKYKRENGMTILQTKRWDELLDHNLKLASERNIGTKFANSFFRTIHQESINTQVKEMVNKPIEELA